MTELKNVPGNLEKFTTPNYIWVTFEHGEAKWASIKKPITIGKHDVQLVDAQHPTDILFHNREIKPQRHNIRYGLAICFISLFALFFFFFGTWLIQNMTVISFLQQPPLTNCDSIRSKYDEDQLFSMAFQEFNSLKRNKQAKTLNLNNLVSRSGALFCFCEQEVEAALEAGEDRFKVYTFKYTDPLLPYPKSTSAPICKTYYVYMTGWGYILEQAFNYLVVILSFVVRTFFIWIAEKVRFMSLTKETLFAMISVFYITFLNYGVIYLAASWDNRNALSGTFVDTLFDGLYPDFNALWFNDVGVLIVAIMVSNMYWPPLEFAMFYGLRLLYRMIDQRSLCPSNSTKTHCKTMQSYVETYAGETFSLSYKYSYMLVVTFVTFLFGSGLPILFPIGLLSLIGLYLTERLMMAYSYKRPPMYGTELNTRTLQLMLGAPILYCCYAAWLFTNQQVFKNSVVINDGDMMFANTNHTISDFWSDGLMPGTFFFIICITYLVYWIGRTIYKCLGFAKKQEPDDEELVPFFHSITKR